MSLGIFEDSLLAVDDNEIRSDSKHSDLDSFSGDLENLLNAEEYEEEEVIMIQKA